MGKLLGVGNWLIRVQGNEHPPVHVHVIHPQGKAVVHLDGTVLNRGAPATVIAQAVAWVTSHAAEVRDEWDRMNNPPAR
jgi:hypothetical protein